MMSQVSSPATPSAAELTRAWTFTLDAWSTVRRPTREVRVGDVGIGGSNPLRVQSMTIADTLDTRAVTDEICALAAAGSEIVRVTAPNRTCAENLAVIQSELRRRNVRVPLVADIHFTPQAALIAAESVQKVRINPGNYADRKLFKKREYSDSEYSLELERLEAAFQPLVLRCKELGVAMRIGTNHGSLSDRILNRYGDTPLGMVESALEFVRICEQHGYRDLVLSMKASDVKVMVQAYRLLAQRMRDLDMRYPFHLGVTEAGSGLAARIKSSIGIGALLRDGIGDTIRVSLTEDSVAEIPVARALARYAEAAAAVAPPTDKPRAASPAWDPFRFERQATTSLEASGERLATDGPPRIEIVVDADGLSDPDLDEIFSTASAADLVLLRVTPATPRARLDRLRQRAADTSRAPRIGIELAAPVLLAPPLAHELTQPWTRLAVVLTRGDLEAEPAKALGTALADARPLLQYTLAVETAEQFRTAQAVLAHQRCGTLPPGAVALRGGASTRLLHAWRAVLADLPPGTLPPPVVLRWAAAAPAPGDPHAGWVELECATDAGALLVDGIGAALQLEAGADPARSAELAREILQASRLRLSQADFIACPSCGRTQFDLQTTTARIEARLRHLKGLKIAVMGCIVNGPGEMADADFGYVGSGPGKIDLYVGHTRVERGIESAAAVDRLVDLIRQHGRWQDPPA
jgi:(E)-4-hydroxy-3-methylbut-2-enyl-diphosphate synthase